ncbi:MAG: hypothetical protein KME52_28540 [Desmonostoc geniculatum HA4340-LM1]|nr:hypothetical protein [Desmonostoc geniculatum HA4340-LM1]
MMYFIGVANITFNGIAYGYSRMYSNTRALKGKCFSCPCNIGKEVIVLYHLEDDISITYLEDNKAPDVFCRESSYKLFEGLKLINCYRAHDCINDARKDYTKAGNNILSKGNVQK